MAGYNLQTYMEEYRRKANSSSLVRSSDSDITDTEIVRGIHEAIGAIANRYRIDVDRVASGTLTAGSADVLMPANRLCANILSVRIYANASINYLNAPLQYLTNEQFESHYPMSAPLETPVSPQIQGIPVHYTISRADPTKIILGPVPNYTRANGIVFEYNPVEAALERVYNQSAITCSVTHGSPTVTLSGSVSDTMIFPGDEWGICPTTNFDGSATTDDTPRRWYQIIAVTTTLGITYLTLGENWTGPATSLTAQRFITAQVPYIEQNFPNTLGYAPVYLALNSRYCVDQPDAAASILALADQWLSKMSLGGPQPDQPLYPTNHYAWMNRGGPGYGDGAIYPWGRGSGQ